MQVESKSIKLLLPSLQFILLGRTTAFFSFSFMFEWPFNSLCYHVQSQDITFDLTVYAVTLDILTHIISNVFAQPVTCVMHRTIFLGAIQALPSTCHSGLLETASTCDAQ